MAFLGTKTASTSTFATPGDGEQVDGLLIATTRRRSGESRRSGPIRFKALALGDDLSDNLAEQLTSGGRPWANWLNSR